MFSSVLAVDAMEREAATMWATLIARQGLGVLGRMSDAERMATIRETLGFDDTENLKIDMALLDMIHRDAPPAPPKRKYGREAMFR